MRRGQSYTACQRRKFSRASLARHPRRLAGKLVDAVSGKRREAYLQDNLFAALRMTRTPARSQQPCASVWPRSTRVATTTRLPTAGPGRPARNAAQEAKKGAQAKTLGELVPVYLQVREFGDNHWSKLRPKPLSRLHAISPKRGNHCTVSPWTRSPGRWSRLDGTRLQRRAGLPCQSSARGDQYVFRMGHRPGACHDGGPHALAGPLQKQGQNAEVPNVERIQRLDHLARH